MSRRKQRSAFDEVSEFDRGKIVVYRDCGLSFREIGSRVGRNQPTIMRICDRWMQEGTTDQRGRLHPSQCNTSTEWSVRKTSIAWSTLTQNYRRLRRQRCDERRMWAAEWNEVLFNDKSRICLQHHAGRIRIWRHRGERMLNSCVMHRHTGPVSDITVWGGIGYHSHTPLVRIAGVLNSQRYISELLEPVVLPYIQGFFTAIFQQDNERSHVTRIIQRFFVNHQIELLPWPARSPDLSLIGNMWSTDAQRLTQFTPSAATPYQLWQRVEAAWSAVPQEHIQSLFESMPTCVAAAPSSGTLASSRTIRMLLAEGHLGSRSPLRVLLLTPPPRSSTPPFGVVLCTRKLDCSGMEQGRL
ncbi:transposable element Tcb1 transposase [Trichonephila clavipes]|nr:transposable element Tcb1 transposase [Trichonephila clavipes]